MNISRVMIILTVFLLLLFLINVSVAQQISDSKPAEQTRDIQPIEPLPKDPPVLPESPSAEPSMRIPVPLPVPLGEDKIQDPEPVPTLTPHSPQNTE